MTSATAKSPIAFLHLVEIFSGHVASESSLELCSSIVQYLWINLLQVYPIQMI